jgi:signal transduction histidine kinase
MMASMSTGPLPTRQPYLLAVLVFWAVFSLAAFVLSTERIDHPFPGFIVSSNLFLGATDLADWTGARAGLVPLDRIVALDGQPVSSAVDLTDRVRHDPPGTPFEYTLVDGRHVTVPSMMLTTWEYVRSTAPFFVAAIVHLGFGGWVLLQRPRLPAAIGHWRYCQIFALFLLGAVLGERWPVGTSLNLLGCALMLPAFVELMLVFPARPANPRIESRIRRAAWAAGGLMCLVVVAGLFHAPWFPFAFNLILITPIIALFVVLGVWAWQAFGSSMPESVKGQARLGLVGLGLSLGPSVVYSVAALFKMPLPGFEFAFMGFCAFPAAVALAIVRHQAFDLNYVLRRATFYTLLAAALGGVYLAAAMVGHLVLGRLASTYGGASVAGFLAAVAVAAAFRPGYDGLKRMVDRWFLGDRPEPLRAVAAFAAGADRLEVEALAFHLVCAVRDALGAGWVQLRWDGRVTTAGVREPGAVPAAAMAIRPNEGPGGELEVGPRPDDRPFGEEERALLDVLATQAALALDRARLFEARLASGVREATAVGRAEAREQLLRQVVHDLGTELSNIAVSTDLARQMPGEPGPLTSIQASLTRIERFLAEKRDRLRTDGRARTALGPGLDAAIATLTLQLALRRQRLETEIAVDEAVVPLSEVELSQVIVNLVGNASKFSPEGTWIRLVAHLTDQDVVIVVEDDGPGVPEDLLDSLGDGRRGAPLVPGDGLGLKNCRALVAAAGGTLAWRNGDRGAVVELKLPVLSQAAHAEF